MIGGDRAAAMAGALWQRITPGALLVADSVTQLTPKAAGAVLVCGSHGGVLPGYLAALFQVRAAIFNDASLGKDEAGIEGLRYLGWLGMPAVSIDYRSARIGDAADMLTRGRVSHVNQPARDLGCAAGMDCRSAATILRRAPIVPMTPPKQTEGRHLLRDGSPRVWALDSMSLVTARDRGQIVVTGSHGGLLGGRPASAAKQDVRGALFNDAGIGADGAGVTRLPVLAARGIAAATVSAESARIGDAHSTYEDGVLSAVNDVAAAHGLTIGMTAREFVARLHAQAGSAPA